MTLFQQKLESKKKKKKKLVHCGFYDPNMILIDVYNAISVSNYFGLEFRVVSGPGISGNLEKSGKFVALEKCQGKNREFSLKIKKSQGISFARNEYR